jgi:hypothetical protein
MSGAPRLAPKSRARPEKSITLVEPRARAILFDRRLGGGRQGRPRGDQAKHRHFVNEEGASNGRGDPRDDRGNADRPTRTARSGAVASRLRRGH